MARVDEKMETQVFGQTVAYVLDLNAAWRNDYVAHGKNDTHSCKKNCFFLQWLHD
jgi:hypothetical protein